MKTTFTTVDDYFAAQPEEVRDKLFILQKLIRQEVPEATECISYQLPAFKYLRMLVWYGGFKKHVSILFVPDVMKHFQKELEKFDSTKSAIRIPLTDKIPTKLLEDMIKYALKVNIEKEKRKALKNKK